MNDFNVWQFLSISPVTELLLAALVLIALISLIHAEMFISRFNRIIKVMAKKKRARRIKRKRNRR